MVSSRTGSVRTRALSILFVHLFFAGVLWRVLTSSAMAQTPEPRTPAPTAAAELTATPAPPPSDPTGVSLAEVEPWTALLLVISGSIGVALLWLIPMLWDLSRSYRAMASVRQQITTKFLDGASQKDLSAEELRLLLRELSRPPRGYPGLTRSLMAFTVITIVAVSQLGLSFFNIAGAEDLRKTIVNSLLAVFASITGFYFGTRAAQTDKSEGAPAAAGPASGLPVVTKVAPSGGPAAGGDTVTLTGSGFSAATEVLFGKTPGLEALAVDDTKITVKTPPGTGTVDVVVVAPKGASAKSLGARYAYAAAGAAPVPKPATEKV